MTRKRGKRAPGTGGVTRIKNGYLARITIGYDANGHQRFKSRTRATSKLAHEALDELRADFAAGRFAAAALAITAQPVAEYLRWWFTTVAQPTIDPNSQRAYAGAIKRLAPLLARETVGSLKRAHVMDAVTALRASGYAPATIELTIGVLHSALAHAVEDQDILTKNVAGRIRLDPVEPPPVRVFTTDEAKQFLAHIRGDRWEALWLVGTHGLRIGEALALRWSDIDLAAGTITVRWNLQRVSAEQEATLRRRAVPLVRLTPTLALTPPKTRSGLRTVPLSRAARAALGLHRARQAQQRLEMGSAWQRLDLVFCTNHGTPVATWNIQSELPKLLARMNIYDMTFHGFRHSATTFLLLQHVDPRTIISVIGHANMNELKRYGHVLEEMQRAAAAAFDATYGGDDVEVG